MTDEAESVVEIERSLRDIESREYDRAVDAAVQLDGPAGQITIRRTYEALPYHNDELGSDEPDSDDEFLDRPDAVHVHIRYYRLEEDGETYFLDRHETWRLVESSTLGDEARFREACERHHLADLQAEYAWATGAAARAERSRPELTPDGWERLS